MCVKWKFKMAIINNLRFGVKPQFIPKPKLLILLKCSSKLLIMYELNFTKSVLSYFKVFD